MYHVVNRFNELDIFKDCPRSGRPHNARSKVIKAVREREKRNPKRSAR